jgi:PAS domain S-box-containing protein
MLAWPWQKIAGLLLHRICHGTIQHSRSQDETPMSGAPGRGKVQAVILCSISTMLPATLTPVLPTWAVLPVLALIAALVSCLLLLWRHLKRQQAAVTAALHESDSDYRHLFENAPLGIYRTTAEGKITLANPAFLRMLGCTSLEELRNHDLDAGKTPSSLVRREMRERLARDGELRGQEARWRRLDGSIIWVRQNARLVRHADGTVFYCEGTVEDITEHKWAEEELLQSQANLVAVIENQSDCIWSIDSDLRLITINSALSTQYEKSFGRPLFVGQTVDELVPPDRFPELSRQWKELYRRAFTGERISLVQEQKVGDQVMYVDVSLNPIVSNGQITGVAGFLRDITARKGAEEALRESVERTRLIVDAAYDAFVAMDAAGCITGWNQQAVATFGWSREEVLGRSLSNTIIPPRYREAHEKGLQRFLATGEGPVFNRRLELSALHRDGHEFPVELTITPIRRGDSYLFSAFVHDITERKRAQTQLEEARDAAEAANRAKSEFLANVSHEIRTPMNGILGMTDLALDTCLTTEQRDYLGMVKSSAESLLAIINDLLDFSKIEAGRLELDPVPLSLRAHLASTLKALALRAHQKGLELACQVHANVPEALIGDPVRLRQIIVNLVGNAIKFTETGEVVVSVGLASQAGNEASNPQTTDSRATCLQVSVRDTGIGVPPDKHLAIFEPFVQADGSMTRRYGGTGLGLAITASLVKTMGGRIWVESEPGKGSTFSFTACMGLASGSTAPEECQPPDSLRGLRALVVDDNATNRLILQEQLRPWGLEPTVVDGGAAALAALSTAGPFDLILLDGQMPGMDGFQLASRLHQQGLHGAIIMMLSSADQPGDAARCRELGITTCLTKPVGPSDLLDALVTALGQPAARSRPSAVSQAESLSGQPKAEGPATTPRLLRILLAEDNLVNRQLAVRLLEKRGHTVVVSTNGRDALAAIERERFDVVLMDLQMPELSGLEVTALVRQRERAGGGHLPIIAMTAHALKGDPERCLEAGCDGYVAKPVQSEELLRTIAAVVSALPPSVLHDPLDARVALASVEGDTSLLQELSQLFQADCARLQAELRSAVAEKNALQLRRAAHTLRGAASSFGACRIVAAAQALEELGQTGQLDNAAELAARLDELLQQVPAALDQLRTQIQDQSAVPAQE